MVDPSCCVAEVMGTDLFTVTPDTVVGSALRLATSRRVHHFLVIDGGNLTGIVCQSDLRHARQGAFISDCMKSPVLCIGPETTVGEAADIMRENEIGCLPVVTGAFLVGMITRDRLVQLTGDAAITEPVEDEGIEEPKPQPKGPCAACGKSKMVKPHFRSAMLPLCADCAAIIPPSEPLKGN